MPQADDRWPGRIARQVARIPHRTPDTEEPLPREEVETPGTKTIATLAAFLDIPAVNRTLAEQFRRTQSGEKRRK